MATHTEDESQAPVTAPSQIILADDYTSDMVFDSIEPIEIRITIAGKQYILREADDAAVTAYRNSQVRSARVVDGKFTGMGDVANSEPLLLSKCLFEEAGRKAVPLAEISKWRHRVTRPLIERLKKISDIDTGDTIEGLEKRIATDQDKLNKLRAEQERKQPKESVAKKELEDSPDGSD